MFVMILDCGSRFLLSLPCHQVPIILPKHQVPVISPEHQVLVISPEHQVPVVSPEHRQGSVVIFDLIVDDP